MEHADEPEYRVELSDLLDEFLNPDARPVIFLEGGHYEPAGGPSDFSHGSLDAALAFGEHLLHRYGKRVRLIFGVLVDDLGAPSAVEIDRQPARVLPSALLETLERHRLIKLDRLAVASERNARNRAVNTLKKLCRGQQPESLLSTVVDAQLRVSLRQDFGEAVTLGYLGEGSASVRCPAIMGQHYADCFLAMKQRFPLSEQLVFLDWSETMDLWKVTGGAKACQELFLQAALEDTACEIVNIFFGDDQGEIFEIRHESPVHPL